jgi:hypothetical protein
LKTFFLKITYLVFVVSMAGFTGCLGPLEAPSPEDRGRVVVSIGAAAGARTIAPDTGEFTKYTLTFSGPAEHDPVDLNGGSVVVDLSPGLWTISATGYTGTNSNYVPAAQGSAQVNVVGEETAQATILLGPITTAAGKGTFSYSVTVPAGAAGSLFLTTAEGGAVADGTIALTEGTTNGANELDPGQYMARLQLEKGGDHAGFTQALHVYSGLISALSAAYTAGDFLEAPPEPAPTLEQIMAPLAGVWYSYYPGIGRLDGYRIGRWEDFDTVMGATKLGLFPNLERLTYTAQTGSATPGAEDFFVFYDDTVYGEDDSGEDGNGDLEITMRYIGIVRAVNVFNDDPDRGAIIIEYLTGCAPQWDDAIKDGQLPFFGIYYRKEDADTVQMANAVDLDAMDNGDPYYTETATLQEAIDKNTVENDATFIVWDVVYPQEREP